MGVLRISKEDLKQKLDTGGPGVPVLLDVRLKYPYEHSSATLPGAIRMAPASVDPSKLPKDRDIVLYDSDPEELVATTVAQELLRAGYRASVLAGGISAWIGAKFPTESKPSPQPAAPPAPAKA